MENVIESLVKRDKAIDREFEVTATRLNRHRREIDGVGRQVGSPPIKAFWSSNKKCPSIAL